MTDSERYLAKARESLASCRADVAAGRCNSAASRAYYAAFQAGVAALLHESIVPEAGNWQHRFVLSQFSGKLVRRPKLLPSDLPSVLDLLFRTRIAGDYEPASVSRRQASRVAEEAARFVAEVERMTKLISFREASAEHEAEHREGLEKEADAGRFVTELQALIRAAVPGAEFSIGRLGPTDYRMYTYIDSEDEIDQVHDALDGKTIDILVDHGIWIVVLTVLRETDPS
ncbi:MAG TPA: HEPN domain-containing protein [Dehalococcoidia bacterium]|nr:HEPN domain-containing protein [Dehalococcoidia bacterium]